MKAGGAKANVGKVAKKVAKTGPKPKAAPKKAAPAKKGTPSKAGFVRSQPTTVPAKDVVAAGARLGLSLTPEYIHKVRSTAKAKAKLPGKKSVAPRKAATHKPSPKNKAPRKAAAKKAAPRKVVRKSAPKTKAGRTVESGFRKLVVDLGVARAKVLLADVEYKVGELIAGK